MVLFYLSIAKSEEEVSALCEADLIGVTCDQIADAADRLGLCSEVLIHTSEDHLEVLLRRGSPLIALVDAGWLYYDITGFGHFVLIVGVEQEEVVYHDPEVGRHCRRKIAEFFEAWERFECLGVRIWKPGRK